MLFTVGLFKTGIDYCNRLHCEFIDKHFCVNTILLCLAMSRYISGEINFLTICRLACPNCIFCVLCTGERGYLLDSVMQFAFQAVTLSFIMNTVMQT